MKERLDVLLVERRLADSREKAKAVISALCKQLQMGGFESALQDLRELSRSI